MNPEEVWPHPPGSEREAYLSVLADKMRYLLRRPRGTDNSVRRRRLVVVFGPREGLVPGSGGRESQVFPVSQSTPSMFRALLMHGPRLAIRGNLEPTAHVFCPKEYKQANLPSLPFMPMAGHRLLNLVQAKDLLYNLARAGCRLLGIIKVIRHLVNL